MRARDAVVASPQLGWRKRNAESKSTLKIMRLYHSQSALIRPTYEPESPVFLVHFAISCGHPFGFLIHACASVSIRGSFKLHPPWVPPLTFRIRAHWCQIRV